MLKILIKLLLLIWFVFKLLLPVQLLHHALASSLKGNTFLTNHKMASLLKYVVPRISCMKKIFLILQP